MTELQAFFSEMTKMAGIKPLLRPGKSTITAQPMKMPTMPKIPQPMKPGTFGVGDYTKSASINDVIGSIPTMAPGNLHERGKLVLPGDQDYEHMTPAKWRRTLIDVPAVVGASALGYGLARTGADMYGEHLTRTGKVPGWVKHTPAIAAGLTSLGAYALGRQSEILKERRIEAEDDFQAAQRARRAKLLAKKEGRPPPKQPAGGLVKKAGIPPAPQSRLIPKKKPSDPWKYDPRETGWYG